MRDLSKSVSSTSFLGGSDIFRAISQAAPTPTDVMYEFHYKSEVNSRPETGRLLLNDIIHLNSGGEFTLTSVVLDFLKGHCSTEFPNIFANSYRWKPFIFIVLSEHNLYYPELWVRLKDANRTSPAPEWWDTHPPQNIRASWIWNFYSGALGNVESLLRYHDYQGVVEPIRVQSIVQKDLFKNYHY